MKFLIRLTLFVSLCLLAHAQNEENEDATECLEKTTANVGMSDHNSQYLIETFPADSMDDCARECCARIHECNATVFEKRDGEYRCTLLGCPTYDECDANWEPNTASMVAGIVAKRETEAERKEAEYFEEVFNSTADVETLTLNETALFEEEEQEIDEQFEEAFGPDIDDLLDAAHGQEFTTQGWDDAWDEWMDDDVSNESDVSEESDESDYGYNWYDGNMEDEDSEEYWDGNYDDSTSDSYETSSESSSRESSSESSSIESSSESSSIESSSESNSIEVELENEENENIDEINSNIYNSHSNNGMYGPSPINDLDYNAVPFIVMGVVASIVFILVVLIFVARHLGRTERLKYRPLSESFPTNSPNYHDTQYGQYHDIE